jgi:type VI secretion system protein ImpA
MATLEELLSPIPGNNPSGENLYYSPIIDKIKEARRQDDAGPQGQWERERKTADFAVVIKLGEDALLKKTKDLQIAAWLTEAWIYRDSIAGLAFGLKLIHGLVERFWDTVYPELEDGDAEFRAKPLEWLGAYFDPNKGLSPILALKSTALTSGGLSWIAYKESRTVGYEQEVKGNEARTKSRQTAIKEGKIPPEEFDKEFGATPKSFYRKLEADCKETAELLTQLNELCSDKFGDVAPSFLPLRNALDEFANAVHILLLKKLETDPDPVEAKAAEPSENAEANPTPGDESESAASVPAFTSTPAPDFSHLSSGKISDIKEAVLHILAAAEFLRRKTPASPVGYLILRALRWGELRAEEQLDGLLEAPAADIRRALRHYAMQKDWKHVIETAEAAMSSGCGRGWMDLQRYSIQACEGLGYQGAAKAMRSELKALLTDYPQLPSATLNDDTGAANPETLAWLKKEGFVS